MFWVYHPAPVGRRSNVRIAGKRRTFIPTGTSTQQQLRNSWRLTGLMEQLTDPNSPPPQIAVASPTGARYGPVFRKKEMTAEQEEQMLMGSFGGRVILLLEEFLSPSIGGLLIVVLMLTFISAALSSYYQVVFQGIAIVLQLAIIRRMYRRWNQMNRKIRK